MITRGEVDVTIQRETKRGAVFTVIPIPQTGLWRVTMNRGGVSPPLCDEKYTSRSKALSVLERYINGESKAK